MTFRFFERLFSSWFLRTIMVSDGFLRQETNYGLFVYSTCAPDGVEVVCCITFYSTLKTGSLYSYYKAGAVGAAFMITGTLLVFVFMVFLFLKASSGMASRCMKNVINHYYGLYYLGFISVFSCALGWGLWYHYVPHTYGFRYPFWLYMVSWIIEALVVLAIFARKIIQGNAKRGGWMSIS